MFQLSQTHNQAFQAKAEADFVREVMQYLRENHAETIVKFPNGEFKVEDLPEETLRKMVEGGILKARSYRLGRRIIIKQFIILMFIFAPSFDKHPDCKQVLESKIIFPNWKIRVLFERVKPNDERWREISLKNQFHNWEVLK